MLPLAICLLLVSQCLAHGVHGQHTPDSQKDKIADSSDVVKDPKIIYNYKQMRANQDPQVEEREESVGQYINNNPATTVLTTTTTTPKPIKLIEKEISSSIDEISDIVVIKEKPHHHHHHHHHNAKHPTGSTSIPNIPEKEKVTQTPQTHYQPPNRNHPAWNQWHYHPGYPAYLPIMPPPPALPAWPELDQLLNHHPHHQKPIPAEPHHISNHKQHRESTTVPPPTITVLHTHTDASKKHSHKHHSSALPSQNDHVSPASAKPVLMEKQPAVSIGHNTKKTHAHRGDHKFNHHGVQTLVTLSPSSTAASMPPPPPTLSPWYDGYGK